MSGEATGIVLCDQVAEYCRCREPRTHDGKHVCPCGGEWLGSVDGDDFAVVTLPPFVGVPGLGRDESW